ncbi:MAG: murein biosynthesis integral membrane protein MurJ [Desulfomonilaceae bacterium]|nr:murein biosynthesis integral membrane protein MurJ [Desulfomonilaceae bacterium]
MAENGTQSQILLNENGTDFRFEKRAATRAAGVVGFWTMLSRVAGFVRDLVIALFLGASTGADAFFVAFRIPNLLRRLFAEGALSAAFVPTYVETLRRDGLTEGERLARITFTFTAIALVLVTVAGIVFSPWIVRIIAPGFIKNPDMFLLTVNLNRIMFPYIFFISLTILASGVLNSMGRFAAPAAAPIILNVCMITAVAVFSTFFNVPPAHALAWGVVAAGLLQLALQIPFMTRCGIRIRPNFDFRHPALRKIGILFAPVALGGAVYQVNVMISTILASMLAPGGVSYLYYADRLVELPLGVFAIALGTAVLPSMSRQAADGDISGLRESVSYSLRLIAFFTIPASVALIVLRVPIVAVLFQRGAFSVTDTHETAYALFWYTVGLWAFSGLKVVTQAFFSLKDTRTPVYVSIGAVIVNLVGGLLLMGPMKQGGLALATSIAAAFNLIVLFVILTRKLGGTPDGGLFTTLLKLIAASAVMGALLAYTRTLGAWESGLTAWNLTVLLGSMSAGFAVFVATAYLVRSRELGSLVRFLRNRGM